MTCHGGVFVVVVVQRRQRQRRTNPPPSRSRRRKINDRSASVVQRKGHSSFAKVWCCVCVYINARSFYNVTSRGKITSVFAGKDTHMPVSFALPFGEKKEDEESNERRTVGNTSIATENREQQQETVGTAFGKIWECYCAFCSRFSSLCESTD